MKLKKIFLIFIELALFSSVLTAESDYDYLLNKYKTIIEKKREKAEAERLAAHRKKIMSDEIVQSIFVKVPGKNYYIMATEVTQKQYKAVMGENPSEHKGDDLPVENVSWFDCVVFCNKLSEKQNLEPCYSYKGSTDVSKWKFLKEEQWSWSESKWEKFNKDFVCNFKASGYRLPTLEEWQYAAKGGENYKYAGSNNLDEVGWYNKNSNDRTHPVAQRMPNDYGLYDMSGNVCEWVWDSYDFDRRYDCGGCYNVSACACEVDYWDNFYAFYRYYYFGFRLVCPSK
jgi:formylglycine-generating enzyme